MFHLPVLCAEAVELLLASGAQRVVDGTTGGGGHAERICGLLPPEGKLVCFDADVEALNEARKRLARDLNRVMFVHSNFRNLKGKLQRLGIDTIDGLLLDLGVSSHQLDEGSRGFSFRADEPLDMRMDRRQPRDARDVVNTYTRERLADVLWHYGEERASRRIASRIVASRPLETTGDLASAVRGAVGEKNLVKSLARVFQAIRIEVNDELGSLKQALADAVDLLNDRGRIVVISYHSLEDRIVKEFFKDESAVSIPSGHKLIPDAPKVSRLRILTRRPLEPGADEVMRNARARSARLRAAERINRARNGTTGY
jgi:16S rRNA (cytosine1402-N4)-methyltransferase